MAEKTCGTCGNGNDCTQSGCTCPGNVNNYNNMRCSGTPDDTGVGAIRVKSRAIPRVKGKTSISRYSGYSPPPDTIAGGAKYGSLPTFVYSCNNQYLGSQLEESPWWIFGGGECRNACAGHEKRSDAWHECMDVCKEKDTSENGGGGFGDWLGDIFKKPSESGCLSQCEDEGCYGDQMGPQSWECEQCLDNCENLRSQAGAFVEKEGGFLALFDKLGGFFAKTKGWGKGDSGLSDDEWKLRAEEDKNKRLVWGIAIFVFIIVIIGFVVFMGRKKK